MIKKTAARKGEKRITGSPSHPIWQSFVLDREARTLRPADLEIEWSAEFENVPMARDALMEAKLEICLAIARTRHCPPASRSE